VRSRSTGINHDQQFQQVLIHRKACGLNQKHVGSAHIVQQLEVNLAIGKALQLAFAQLDAHKPRDLFRQWAIGRSGEELEPLIVAQSPGPFPLRGQFGLFHLRTAV
jgi:hypothetical protein